MVAFAILMLVVGAVMLVRRAATPRATAPNWTLIIASGAGVGLLTGILGVGGGFLIVPALVMLVGLPMNQAVGTSLVIIAANSVAGLLGHLSGSMFDVTLTLTFVAAGLVGAFAGARLAHRISTDRLRQVFATFVIVLALFLLFDNFIVG
ncbi:MAG: sulfite exporter TauE/SafE family protein [Chloroflexi bacterium]|nr:sulfite exporter TauE/SafE family protein [Chloroflexota bacterium]